MEIWKDVPKYEGLYEVSNTGKVRSKEGKTNHSVLHGKRVFSRFVRRDGENQFLFLMIFSH